VAFKPLKSLLSGAMAHRKPLQQGVRSAVILDTAREVVETIFPPRLRNNITPSAFRDGVITLTVRGPAYSQEVRMRAAKFLKLLNTQVGEGVVKRIKTRLDRPNQL
jgi:predicted nucleic acid-binding Zn ribbon protein